MKIELLVRNYPRMIGLARYTVSLQKHLTQAGVEYTNIEPAYPKLLRAAHKVLRPLGYDVRTFFTTYPVSAPLSKDAVKHLTAQTMASLFSFQPGLKKVVITVHDIIPYLMRDDPQQTVYRHFYDHWVDERAMHNIKRADRIMADSSFTAQMLVDKLGCSPGRIRVVLLGLDHELFHPSPVSPEFRARFGLEPGYRYLLYVGSENPRKNLPRLIEAIEKVKRKKPNVKLLKVGTPEYLVHYELLKSQIHSAGLDDDIVFINHVSQEDLITLYAAADVFVFPSLYEGFGLPILEAMACGTPVICSNASSLPELAGNASISPDPCDADAWAEAIVAVLTDNSLRQDLSSRGLARASQFTWERTIQETMAVYKEVDSL